MPLQGFYLKKLRSGVKMECLIYCVLYLFCFVFLVWFYLFVSPFSPECDMRLKSGLEMECLICICLFVCI